MAAKNHGIFPDLVIHPGETISDVLEERGIAQKELAQRAGVSEAFLSDVIHGKKDISKGLAMGLEYALAVPASFWLNLQANYDAELLALQEEDTIQPEEIAVLHAIHEVVDYLIKAGILPAGLTQKQTGIRLRRHFRVRRLTDLAKLAPTGAFRLSDKAQVDSFVLGAWLCICEVQDGSRELKARFDPAGVETLVDGIKKIMCTLKGDPQSQLIALFAEYGIDFSVVHNFRGAPVHGYISKKDDGTYQMVLTLRGAFADIFWFSLFHELGHIANGDLNKPGSFIDADQSKGNEMELAADRFASEALLDPDSYRQFLCRNDFSYPSIEAFSRDQMVPSYVVIGRLQKESLIPWSRFTKYKPRYKWAAG